jgi:hypothetical protein
VNDMHAKSEQDEQRENAAQPTSDIVSEIIRTHAELLIARIEGDQLRADLCESALNDLIDRYSSNT